MKKEKIVLGISGGVDSSVAAVLLKKDGYDVHGVFMKTRDDKHAICSAEDDYADALSVCKKLNIPLKKLTWYKILCNLKQPTYTLVKMATYFTKELTIIPSKNTVIQGNKKKIDSSKLKLINSG